MVVDGADVLGSPTQCAAFRFLSKQVREGDAWNPQLIESQGGPLQKRSNSGSQFVQSERLAKVFHIWLSCNAPSDLPTYPVISRIGKLGLAARAASAN